MADGAYRLRIKVIDDATERLKSINKQMNEQLAPQRRLQKETERFYKLQQEGHKKWQSSVADFSRSLGLNKVGDHFDRWAMSSRKAAGGVGDLIGAFKGFAGVMGLAVTAGSAFEGMKASLAAMATQANELRKLSAVTGTTPTYLHAAISAGKVAGVSEGETASSYANLAQSMQQSVLEPSSLAARLDRFYNVPIESAKKWQALSPDKAMGEYADVFKRMKDSGVQGAGLAEFASAHGISASMIPQLTQGKDAYLKSIDQANKNNPWTPEMQAHGEALSKAMGEASQKMEGFSNFLNDQIMVAATSFVTGLGNFVEGAGHLLDGWYKWRDAHIPGYGGGAAPEAGKHAPGGRGGSQSRAGASSVADGSLNPNMKGLLDTIAATESGGRYDAAYGTNRNLTPDQMASNADIPGAPITSGPNSGKTSSASGRYQFLNGTWQEAAQALGLKDRSPANQDKAAAWLARRDYARKTGRNLDADLANPDPTVQAGIPAALHDTWTSLPGGIEQGQGQQDYAQRLAANEAKYTVAAGAPAQVAANSNQPGGQIDVNINGNVPGTKVSASATGGVFAGPPKVAQTMPMAGQS